uniref:Polymerase PB2 n=1 Tax=Dermapteran orthomyxo-related virus OKIAV170 TaxID=2746276 RepID=A0A7D7F8I5_9ORTO|nr:polymerase PB2 [Dermapteran orthomyxo-related virus OKIAV170]
MTELIKTRGEKEMIIKACRMINRADPKTMKILRMMNLNNLRLIEKSSRNTKDPNPVSATMIVMGTKYPITVDSERMRELNVPEEMIATTREGRDDTHMHGRIRCKKELIDWWIEHSPRPTPEDQKLVNFMYSNCREEARRYYSIKWRDASIKFGPVNLSRAKIATRSPQLRVPRPLREDIVTQILLPEFVTHYIEIEPALKESILELAGGSLEVRMALVNQIRILLNMMDERVRTLPIIPNCSLQTNTLKHALVHSNLLVENVDVILREPETYKYSMILLARCLYSASSIQPRELIKDACKRITFNKIPIMDLLNASFNTENDEIKWLRALNGLPVTTEHVINGVTYSPHPGRNSIILNKNPNGVEFKSYVEIETVSFKKGGLRGFFTHCASSTYHLTSNYTDRKELANLLAEVAVYTRWRFLITRGNSMRQLKDKIRRKVRESPWEYLAIKREEWYKISNRNMITSFLEINQNVEYNTSIYEKTTVGEAGEIINVQTNNKFNVMIPNNPNIVLPEEFIIGTSVLDDFLPFRRWVRAKIMFYLRHKSTLKEKINQGVFDWENRQAIVHLKHHSLEISLRCRALIKTCDFSTQYTRVCFYYLLSNSEPTQMKVSRKNIFELSTNLKIDLTLKEGIFRYNPTNCCYYLWNIRLSDQTEMPFEDIEKMGFKYGYRYIRPQDEYPLVSMQKIKGAEQTTPDGFKFRTKLNGRTIGLMRDYFLDSEILKTLQRNKQERREMTLEHMGARGSKRAGDDEQPSTSSYGGKRAREELWKSIAEEPVPGLLEGLDQDDSDDDLSLLFGQD